MERPRGHTEIVGSVVQAATLLFSQRGPAAVSLREIATTSGVSRYETDAASRNFSLRARASALRLRSTLRI